VPITQPAMVTVAIFSAPSARNDLPLAFSDHYSTDYQLLFAALTIITIPMIAIDVAFKRQIVNGRTDGPVKG
jgi:raffinose/stachyose/melibiose transport system permease protein